MQITTVTSRELNQDTSRAKRAVLSGPVFITDRGRPAHVLHSIEAYRKLVGEPRNLADVLAMPGLADIDCEPRSGAGRQISADVCSRHERHLRAAR